MTTLYDFEVKDIEGRDRKLGELAGKVCLVVNVASRCGLTPQYDGLERLYERFRDRGFEVLGFPCNQFGSQEPGRESEIREFCTSQFGVEFPMFSKLDVNGAQRHPLYAWLTSEATEPDGVGDIAWNFAKFLVDREGRVVARFAPPVEPCADEVVERVEAALGDAS